MAKFQQIDLKKWPRKGHYKHYMQTVRCTYSTTVQIDIDGLTKAVAEKGLKAYPAHIYLLATAVNAHKEFRMTHDDAGNLGYYDIVDPAYTIFCDATKTFSNIYTPYDAGFDTFYKNCVADMQKYATGELFPQQNMPKHIFDISSIPWLAFSAFDINIYSEGTHTLPIFTLGQYIKQKGKIYLPIAIQVHHAVCDGYHVGQFVRTLTNLAKDYAMWLG